MPRSLIIGNGSVLATYDSDAQMRDLYYPHVGMEDHTQYGDVHKVGVWVDDVFLWFDDPSWERSIHYVHDTAIGNVVMKNASLGLEITATDFVHPDHNILVRRMRLLSTDGKDKEVRLFFHHDLHIYGDKQKDTAFYEPYTNTVIHYRQKRYFLIGGESSNATECRTGLDADIYQSVLHSMKSIKKCGISEFSIGKAEYRGLEGTWRDAEDGKLAMTTIDQGSVDSTVGIYSRIEAGKETTVSQWMCFGKSLKDVIDLHQIILNKTPGQLQKETSNHWAGWIKTTNEDFGSLSDAVSKLYKRSLMTIRLHTDNGGGIIAAADADIMEFNRDTYTYVWPRDGAFVSLAMDTAGYGEIPRRFFEFCKRVQTKDGYLLHKYNPDDSIGSSWHPWFRDNEPQLPIQEDETALVLYALWKHFEQNQDFEFLQGMYETFIKKAAKFLTEFCEKESGLPLASYDPWEEHRGIFTYTTACTIAGLDAACNICTTLGHHTHAKTYKNRANAMRKAMEKYLFEKKKKRFLKKIKRENGKTIEPDDTMDASLVSLWKLGVLSPDDPRVVSTMEQLLEALEVRTDIGGYARYTNDYYHSKIAPTEKIPGNPWIITTLWIAQWHITHAKQVGELEKARNILEWVVSHASSSGLLPEQLHPLTGEALSVSPLTWSHATFVETVLLFTQKEKKLQKEL